MKGYDISIFVIFLMFSANILSASGFLDSSDCGQPGKEPCGAWKIYDTTNAHTLNSTFHGADMAPTSENDLIAYAKAAISQFGLLLDALIGIIKIIAYSSILVPVFLGNLGFIPTEVNAAITIGVWISYIVAIMQFKSRSSLMGTE